MSSRNRKRAESWTLSRLDNLSSDDNHIPTSSSPLADDVCEKKLNSKQRHQQRRQAKWGPIRAQRRAEKFLTNVTSSAIDAPANESVSHDNGTFITRVSNTSNLLEHESFNDFLLQSSSPEKLWPEMNKAARNNETLALDQLQMAINSELNMVLDDTLTNSTTNTNDATAFLQKARDIMLLKPSALLSCPSNLPTNNVTDNPKSTTSSEASPSTKQHISNLQAIIKSLKQTIRKQDINIKELEERNATLEGSLREHKDIISELKDQLKDKVVFSHHNKNTTLPIQTHKNETHKSTSEESTQNHTIPFEPIKNPIDPSNIQTILSPYNLFPHELKELKQQYDLYSLHEANPTFEVFLECFECDYKKCFMPSSTLKLDFILYKISFEEWDIYDIANYKFGEDGDVMRECYGYLYGPFVSDFVVDDEVDLVVEAGK